MLKIKETSEGFLVYKKIENQEYPFALFYKMTWKTDEGHKVWIAEERAREYAKYLEAK